nr:3-methyladenine DNA glycosylase [Psychromicrobium sp. YIM S02556]
MTPEECLALQEHQEQRVDRYIQPYLQRRSAGQKHPVEDFLFTYYSLKPAQLRRWHPGAGVVLCGAQARQRLDWRFYRPLTEAELRQHDLAGDEPAITMDVEAFCRERSGAIDFARVILHGTAARPGNFGCFGLHEWAMAYRSEDNGVRHEYLPLRLGASGTDAVVEAHRIRCSHIDAFRFFTPQAVSLNELQPSRETQRELEQPGCLHANMDLYKWAYKLLPLVPSELVLEAFELSWRIRIMDMRASPYDLADWGYPALPIETTAGKADYVSLQRGFADDAAGLRERIARELEQRLSLGDAPHDAAQN